MFPTCCGPTKNFMQVTGDWGEYTVYNASWYANVS